MPNAPRHTQRSPAEPVAAWTAGAALAVALLVAAVHWPVLGAQARAFDEGQYLRDDSPVHDLRWVSVRRFFTEILEPTLVAGYYQPLTMTSLMLDCARGGGLDDLRPFHETNLVLHALNSALVVVLVVVLFGAAAGQRPTLPEDGRHKDRPNPGLAARVVPAALAGLLFGVHPLTVEPVAWVVERKTLLATAMALLCLVLFVVQVRRRSLVALTGALVAFLLALLAKPTIVTVPALLLVLCYWPLRSLNRRTVLATAPFFLAAGVFAAITYVSQDRTGTTYAVPNIPLTVCHNAAFYVAKFIWPANLTAFYPYPDEMTLGEPALLAGVAGTAALLALLLVSLRWTRAVFAGGVFYLVAALPTLGFVGFTDALAADKYAYFPLIGLLLPPAALLARFWRADAGRRAAWTRGVATAVVVGLAVGAAWRTRGQIRPWITTDALYAHLLAHAPRAPNLHNNYGMHCLERQEYEAAAAHFARAVELKPDYQLARGNLGVAWLELGRLEPAAGAFQDVLAANPADEFARRQLAWTRVRQARWALAEVEFQRLLDANPDDVDARCGLAAVAMATNRPAMALRHFEQAVALAPDNVAVRLDYGRLQWQLGRRADALAQFRRAVDAAPRDVRARMLLGDALGVVGDVAGAAEQYRAVLTLDPGSGEARAKLEQLATSAGDTTP